MAGAGAGASLGAVGTVVRGRAPRQERPAERLRFPLVWDASTGQCVAWCACVETRPCDRAATGVVREAVEAEGMVCRRRMISGRPRDATECARVAVVSIDSELSVRPVCVYSLWLSTGQAQGRAVLPTHPPHTTIVSVHGSDRYMVYHVLVQLISRRPIGCQDACFRCFRLLRCRLGIDPGLLPHKLHTMTSVGCGWHHQQTTWWPL